MGIGVGARALAMGSAHVAVAEDVTSVYWNPAGLTSMKVLQIHGMHSERFSGVVNWDFLGVGIPTKGSFSLAVGLFRLAVDGIPFTALRDPTRPIGEIYVDEHGHTVQNDVYAYKTVNDAETAFVVSFGKRVSPVLSMGGNVKIIRKSVDAYGAWGLGFDIGMLLRPFHQLQIGAVLLDGTSTLIAWSGGRKELILPHLKVGAAYPVEWGMFRCLPSLEFHVDFQNRGSGANIAIGKVGIEYATGIEIEFKRAIALRMGADRGDFTTGAGLHFSIFQVDYGFSQHAELGESHRVSLTLFWDREKLPRF